MVGSSIPRSREVDSALVARARVFVDLRESALHEAGDLLIPMGEGVISEQHIEAELGEVVERGVQRGQRDVTLFKSLGIAVEDIAAARFVLDRAKETGRGVEVDLGGQAQTGLGGV